MEVPSIYLNRILADMAKRGASSLHLSVGSAPMARIKGKLETIEEGSILQLDILNKIIDSFLEPAELEELKKEKEIIAIKTFGGNFRFRVNVFYQKGLPSVSFNYISGIIRSLSDYKFPEHFKDIIKLNSGLLVVAGSNDSGKTSTIASFIEEINKNEKKYIITLENPIEYLFVNKKSIIEQRQIGSDVASYGQGIRHCMEEDVDLAYIDDTKKEFEKVIHSILELASGNCLVILEMNAENSVRVVEKIVNITSIKISKEAASYNLADALVGVISQKLIPSIGGGLSLAFETLVVNSAIKSLIREGKIYQLESIIQTSRGEGMISLKRSLDELVSSGNIKKEDRDRFKI